MDVRSIGPREIAPNAPYLLVFAVNPLNEAMPPPGAASRRREPWCGEMRLPICRDSILRTRAAGVPAACHRGGALRDADTDPSGDQADYQPNQI